MARGVYVVGKYRLQRFGDGWAAVWHDDSGTRRRYQLDAGPTQAEGIAALNSFARRQDLLTAKEVRTIAEIWTAYLADRRLEGKRSVEIMEFNWKALAPYFAGLSPADVTKRLCMDYTAARRKQGRQDATILTELRRIRTALMWAEKAKLVEKAPAVWMPPEPRARERWLTREEVQNLIECAGTPHIRLYLILAIATAGRTEALLDLTWDRVDFERGTIQLDDPERDRTSKGRATVPMNDMVRAALQTDKAGALTPYVIEWAQDRVRSVKKGFAAAVARAGIEHCTPHDLRRTAASWMVMAGVPMEDVARYLGHRDTRMTWRVYGRFSPTHLRSASEAVNLDLRRKVG